MTQRGRGLLSINPSNNPFFQTTASEHGLTPEQRISEWKLPVDKKTQLDTTQNNTKKDEHFAFLYTRTSDAYGAKIESRTSSFSQLMEPIPKWKRDFVPPGSVVVPPPMSKPPKPDVEKVLEHYVQNAKSEDPRYTTSSNEIGKKAPTVATYVAERESRPQGFSKSFNGVKPKNSSLNTSLTKSNVHPSLDPQFV